MKNPVFDNNAKKKIYSELKNYPDVETGGVLLGYIESDKVYIKEVVCGGDAAIREPGAFQYDADYIEEFSTITANRYTPPLYLVGIWHKHNHTLEPAFSYADYQMHRWLIGQCGRGISCLFQKRQDGQYQLQILGENQKIMVCSHLWQL
ncbi:MAG: hypothetical protein HDR04_20715 [Lachnospiraceae bacterium]|nr:hypothetical protein [Lachnospiraceae bacterium]